MTNSVSSSPSSSSRVASCFAVGARDRRPPNRRLAFLANPAPDMIAESSPLPVDGNAAIEGISPANDLALVWSDAVLESEEEFVVLEVLSASAVNKREPNVSGAIDVRCGLLLGRECKVRLS